MSNASANPYDEVPFPSQPLPHTRPARLQAIAAMFGMQPAPADRCCVLELGCGTGGNLIPLADRCPQSRFVGVDYSEVQIEVARRAALALGLTNLELRCASITDLGNELGPFDYIICHGVYTWVARAVQNNILALCRATLNPQGVAYVSYNTYPAWHLRSLLRRLLRGAASAGSSSQQVDRGRARLSWLATAIAGDQTPFGKLLTTELDAIRRRPDEYLFHEYFESDNVPLYFHEFAHRAADAGLGYLGDAEPSTMFASYYGRATAERLQRITEDPISSEQHLDMLCNRGFRKTLLCHREASPSRHLLPDRLEGLYFSGKFVPRNTALDLKRWSLAEFSAPDGSKISHSAPVIKALLYHLGAQWPRSLSIEQLAASVAKLIAVDDRTPDASSKIREAVILNIVQCVASGVVEPTSTPDTFTPAISRCPQVSRVARLQAATSSKVTNCRHESVRLDEQSRNLLGYLDGQRDQDELLAALLQAGERGEMAIPGGSADQAALAAALRQWLTMLAAQALLVN